MAYTYKYPRPAVTADCIVITKEAEPKVLLIQRGDQPFKGGWAFPGGFLNMDETTEQCAIRELEEETGLHISDVHQIGAYSKVDRDPRGRTVTVAYLAIIDEPVAVTGQDDAAKAEWWPLSDLPHLAFDHYDISGELYNFRCAKCKEIISISADELASQRYFPTCPKCGAENEEIHNWNPIEGHCPKCGKQMQEVPGMIIMAD